MEREYDVLKSPEKMFDPERGIKRVEILLDKGSGVVNEDRALTASPVFAVIDGATSLNKYRDKNGETGGSLAAGILSEEFRTKEGTLLERGRVANQALQVEMANRNIDTTQKENLWQASAAVIEIHPDRIDWFQVADCFILFIYDDGSYKLATPYIDFDAPLLKKWKDLGAMPQAQKWSELSSDLINLRRRQNVDFGAMSGEVEAEQFFLSGTVDRKNMKRVVLFTDGALIPKEDAEAEENFDEFIEILVKGGLEAVKDRVRTQEKSDPDCIQFPRFKLHDDMGAIDITLE